MPRYYVNQRAQSTGEHEVHKEGCTYLPEPQNRKDLGFHPDCHSAVREAKKTYDNVDGCFFCCNPCHTR